MASKMAHASNHALCAKLCADAHKAFTADPPDDVKGAGVSHCGGSGKGHAILLSS
jgi:hypothetical protein